MVSNDLLLNLRDLFSSKFSDDELDNLVFALGLDFENLSGKTKSAKSRELASMIVRHDLVGKLAIVGPRERKDIDWKAHLSDSSSKEFLEATDRAKIVVAIAHQYDMGLGPAVRGTLLSSAGLEGRIIYLNLAQSPILVARELIADLEGVGILPGRPEYHALGALLDYIRQMSDTSNDDARFFAEVLVKYRLVNDLKYLRKLIDEYRLDKYQADVPADIPPPSASIELAEKSSVGKKPVKMDNFLYIELLAGAIYTSQAVGRIELPRGRARCTGFLVGPDLMLTTYHNFKSKDLLASAVVRFDYHANADGATTKGRVYEFQPDFYVGSSDMELDFALLRLKGEPLADRKFQPGDEGLGYLELLRYGRHRGYLLLAPRMIVQNEQVNIIQHPNGNPLSAVLTENYVLVDMTSDRVHYLADTLPGSTGAPVLNRYWEVVALQHSGGPHPREKLPQDLVDKLSTTGFNEGIPMRAILPKIERYLPR